MSINNYWTFEILPSGNFLNSYSRNSGNFTIGENSDAMPLNFLLNSTHFADKENPKDVYAISTFVVALINGYTKLKNIDPDEHNLVWLGNLYKNGEKVRKDYICDVDLLSIDGYLSQKAKSNEFINKGFDEGLIRNILLYCNAGWDLINMYKISDEISAFLKDKSDIILNYVKKSDYNAFGATANNYSVSGLNARHGKSKNLAPKRTMSVEEASTFIRDLIKLVIDKYFGFDIKFIPKQDNNFDLESIEF